MKATHKKALTYSVVYTNHLRAFSYTVNASGSYSTLELNVNAFMLIQKKTYLVKGFNCAFLHHFLQVR